MAIGGYFFAKSQGNKWLVFAKSQGYRRPFLLKSRVRVHESDLCNAMGYQLNVFCHPEQEVSTG